MRLYTEGDGTVDTGGATIPMEPIGSEALSGKPAAVPTVPRLQKVGHVTQILYHLAGIIVILLGVFGALGMRLGWFAPLSWGSGAQPAGRSVQSLLTATPAVHSSLPVSLLARDTFQRPDQVFWGLSSPGANWGGDANSARAFGVAGAMGAITGGEGFFNALLGPRVADEEVQTSASISRFNGGRDNFGAVLRFTSNDSYYKAYLDGQSLVLLRRVAGVSAVLVTVPFLAQDGLSYTIRFRARGAQLLAAAWLTGSGAPANWMVMATDSSLAPGYGGLRVLLQRGVVVRVSAFVAETANQAN